MEFSTKFNIGEEIYFLTKENVKEACPVCLGNKTVTIKNKKGESEIECFNCHGVGFYTTSIKRYVVNEKACKIVGIKANISKNKVNLKYSIADEMGRKFNRSENSISKNLEELYRVCDNLNYIEEIPTIYNYNKKTLKDIVDVYICGGRVLKNTFKYAHETTTEDIKSYIEDNKVICVEEGNNCTLYTTDFSKIKTFADILKDKFPEKKLILGSSEISMSLLDEVVEE